MFANIAGSIKKKFLVTRRKQNLSLRNLYKDLHIPNTYLSTATFIWKLKDSTIICAWHNVCSNFRLIFLFECMNYLSPASGVYLFKWQGNWLYSWSWVNHRCLKQFQVACSMHFTGVKVVCIKLILLSITINMFEFSKLVFKNVLRHTLFIGSNHRILLYGQSLHLQLMGQQLLKSMEILRHLLIGRQ